MDKNSARYKKILKISAVSIISIWCMYIVIKLIIYKLTGDLEINTDNEIFFIINILIVPLVLLGTLCFNIFKIIKVLRLCKRQNKCSICNLLSIIFLIVFSIFIVFVGIAISAWAYFVFIIWLGGGR